MFCLSHLYVVLQILIVTVPQRLDLMQAHKGPEYAPSGRVTASDVLSYVVLYDFVLFSNPLLM